MFGYYILSIQNLILDILSLLWMIISCNLIIFNEKFVQKCFWYFKKKMLNKK